jgi:predicted phage terminase large subunit-like protein
MPVYVPELPGLHENQKTVAKSNKRWKILCAGRRFGKTRLGIHLCMEVALNGGRAWWVAPTFAIARVGWRALENAAYSFPPEIQPKVSLANMEVIFPNGGSISCKSADNPQRLRGEGLDFLVMDEAAFIKPDVWQEVLRPTLTERKGSALFISTPMGMDNWFYDLWETAEKGSNWERFRFSTYDNPMIDDSEIDSAKEEVGSIVFAQEYLAEFVEAGQGLLKPEWMTYFDIRERMYIGGGTQWNPGELVHFGAADLAVTTKNESDYTVILSCAISPDMKLYVEDMVRVKIEGPDIVPTIQQMYNKYRWNYVCIEKQGFSKNFIQMAQRVGMRVREMDASKDKITQAMPLSARMEGGDVLFRRNASWLEELERELMTFPVGRHDDIVDALGLAVQTLVQRRSWQAY